MLSRNDHVAFEQLREIGHVGVDDIGVDLSGLRLGQKPLDSRVGENLEGLHRNAGIFRGEFCRDALIGHDVQRRPDNDLALLLRGLIDGLDRIGGVRRHWRIQPDGAEGQPTLQKTAARVWTRTEALQTRELRTVMLAFGLALLVQIGFLTHQVSLLLPAIGQTATAVCVTSAAVLSFGGRLLLARFSDRLDVRVIACGVLLQATLGLAIASIFSEQAWALIVGVLSYGMTAGNTTTLPPVIVRREFGAVSFGAIFGIAAMLIQIMSAMGPAFFGVLHDLSNGYQLPLGLAALLNVIAAVVILSGRRRL